MSKDTVMPPLSQGDLENLEALASYWIANATEKKHADAYKRLEKLVREMIADGPPKRKRNEGE